MAEWQIPEDVGRNIYTLFPWIEFDHVAYGGPTTVYRWSDLAIQVNNLQYIEPRIIEWVRLIRALADDYGNFESSQFGFVIADHDRTFLGLGDDATKKYFQNRIVRVNITDSSANMVADTPFMAARGVVRGVRPVGNRKLQFTCEDYLSSEFSMMYLDEEMPRRRIEASRFINTAFAVNGWNPNVNGLPEPIIYGTVSDHTLAAVDQHGAVPCYAVGAEEISGNQGWVRLLVAGHACKQIRTVYFNGTAIDAGRYGVDVLAPGKAGWPFAQAYRDIGGRRYTIIYAIGPDASAAVAGTGTWSVDVDGIESVGDASGALLTHVYDQYQHWLNNFALGDYSTGNWPAAPTMADGTARVDANSFTAAKTSIAPRAGGAGYLGGGVIGNNGELATKREIIFRFNTSCDARSAFNRKGQYMVVSGEPQTPAATFTETSDIIEGSFTIDPAEEQQRNVIPFSYRMNYLANAWGLAGKRVRSDASINAYLARKLDQERPLHFIRDDVTAEDIAVHFLHRKMHPPRRVTFSTGLQGLRVELGQTINVTHRDAHGGGATGWVNRQVMVERIDWAIGSCVVTISGWDYGSMDLPFPIPYAVDFAGIQNTSASAAPVGTGGGGSTTVVVVHTGGPTRFYMGGSDAVMTETAANTFVRHPSKVDVILDSNSTPTKWLVNVHVWTSNGAVTVTPRIVAGTGDDGTGEFLSKSVAGTGQPSSSLVPAWQQIEVTTVPGVKAYRLEVAASAANTFVGAREAVGGW